MYHPPLVQLIHDFKYYHKTALRRDFGQYIIQFIQRYNLDIHQCDALIPLPLHKTRQRERGYNQAELLGQHLSAHYQIPLWTHVLSRRRWTRSQTELDPKERWTNMEQAFKINYFSRSREGLSVRSSCDQVGSFEETSYGRATARNASITGKTLLLIDDILTTGSTASHAARTLKDAGAARVGVLTLAITVNSR